MLTRPALAGGRLHPAQGAGGIWWNPAVTTARGTIEEKIELMLAEKRQLADELIDGDGEVGLTELPDDELLDLVRLDVTRAAP